MKPDSFENFSRYKILVNEKLAEFISNFENSSKKTKALLHYQSVINVSRGIIKFNNSEANNLKDSILEYLDIVKDVDYSNDNNGDTDIHYKKRQSLDLYKKYVSPVGSYLIHESGFGPDLSLKFHLITGIILDTIIYYFFSKSIVPLSTILVTLIGIKSRNKRRKEGKVFSPFK